MSSSGWGSRRLDVDIHFSSARHPYAQEFFGNVQCDSRHRRASLRIALSAHPPPTQAERVIAEDFDLNQTPIGPNTYVVIATQHKSDHLWLQKALQGEAAYVALIASHHRAKLVLDYLAAEGVPADRAGKNLRARRLPSESHPQPPQEQEWFVSPGKRKRCPIRVATAGGRPAATAV
jgi:hypothetical protein